MAARLFLAPIPGPGPFTRVLTKAAKDLSSTGLPRNSLHGPIANSKCLEHTASKLMGVSLSNRGRVALVCQNGENECRCENLHTSCNRKVWPIIANPLNLTS